ncbi:hypothetical protein B0H12DRAFT_159323 [Mycena haematopus]|nr:hypothetical protein B0H12DRAFT_159323 [Mycena haematopus]
MQNPESNECRFPVELERVIFEMAADIRPLSIITFMLVARRVKEWVRPLLYRTIPVCGRQTDIPEGHPFFRISTLLDMIHSGIFPGDTVRNLFIQVGNKDDRKTLLSACPQIENLWIYTHLWPDQFASISALPLKRLTCNLDVLYGPAGPCDLTHRLFSRLTHLEILRFRSQIPDLALIPHLSHLAFSFVYQPIGFLSRALSTCKSLRVLVVLNPSGLIRTAIADHQELTHDKRFVVMECKYTEDWIVGAHTGIDYWSRAEEFVEKRRSGEIDALEYICGPIDKPQL